MRIIDLTLPLTAKMEVYPGDPEPKIIQIHTIPINGWNMTRIEINSHDGTHVDVPYHMIQSGKKLDDYELTAFSGPCRVFDEMHNIRSGEGVLVRDRGLDRVLAERLVASRPKFVGLSNEFEIDVEIENYLLQNGIILYERLTNTEKLPESFVFFGMPLSLPNGDGSPVRAFAIVE